ncbi:hypothetical protein DTL42_22525 [Bremerella cremea]|uniref:Uncharacterized protein n=1 Tax=Bremerella cremea TaxID=1031537 RepID=A0A368KNC8_9BACT|nr:hypothetical protein DTL42_22525 [Bremerella cremea]
MSRKGKLSESQPRGFRLGEAREVHEDTSAFAWARSSTPMTWKSVPPRSSKSGFFYALRFSLKFEV